MLLGIFCIEPWTVLAAAPPILPDQNAPAAHQPLVQQTVNGVLLVQITGPTKGGVSRNQYRNFNVPQQGAILNNSHGMTTTQLAGYVQGTPNMNRGPAKIIVNEVTGTNRSAMNGFLEVAGARASVVVATPNGITVNGGGFLNTSHAMLTTGRPTYDGNGDLSGLRVTGGTIRIEGAGLDATRTDSLAILTRAAQINAGIWANEAHVITGVNDVSYPGLTVKAGNGTGKRPEVTLDVAAIGGMYANRIFLVGTEKGLGVNMEGTLSATQHMVLEANGDLHVACTTTAP